MTRYYLIKIRKDLAKALPIVILLLVFAYFVGKSLIQWEPQIQDLPSLDNATPPKTINPLTDINCESLQPQLDSYAQQAFKEGYLCARKNENCPVPEGITHHEREQLQKDSKGYYFDAKNYVNKKSTTKDYYIGLMTGTYACTPKNLELLKKFIYEQQWKAGILYT
ncbi:MAG TPA: hypothetical protein VJG90_01655 [Candidatus Nanoarchaeia archaeon]|nr:hypothetical protein [Candidatus Nanoarchaeia archaeon]